MSAKADALRFPGQGSGNRSPWFAIVAAVLVAAAVAVTFFVLASRTTGTAPERVGPAAGSQPVSGTTSGVSHAGTVIQVGGTSVYRYHPLPGANGFFEPVGSATGAASTGGHQVTGDPTVGGSGAYRYHGLP
ncbi:MAG: hypothetical protein ACJ77A_13665 [Actinomycetota bacterium]